MSRGRKPNVVTFSYVLRKSRLRQLYSSNDFFYYPFKYVFKDNVLYFNHTTIDDKVRVFQAWRGSDHSFQTNIMGEWPVGTFLIDPDSTEDQLIIDFNNII